MTESTQVLHQLKVATNYSKLAMHKCGPRSFKSGQGAMCKVLYKFGDGKLSLKKLEERLGWDGHEVIRVAEKAQENGYVCFATSKKGKLSVALTDKGTMVVEKRLAAEDRAADEVLEGLTASPATITVTAAAGTKGSTDFPNLFHAGTSWEWSASRCI